MSKKLQKLAKTGKTTEKEYLIDKLDLKHQGAIWMKLSGAEYLEIAKKMHVTYSYARTIFSVHGLCYAAYNELKNDLNTENHAGFLESRTMIENFVPRALMTLMLHSKKYWKPAVEFLHIAGYTPETVVKVKEEAPQESEELKALREFIYGKRTNDKKRHPMARAQVSKGKHAAARSH